MASRVPSNAQNQQGSGNANNVFGPNRPQRVTRGAPQTQPSNALRPVEQKDTTGSSQTVANTIIGRNGQPLRPVQFPVELKQQGNPSLDPYRQVPVPAPNNQDRVPVGHGSGRVVIPQNIPNSSPSATIKITVQNTASNTPPHTVSITVQVPSPSTPPASSLSLPVTSTTNVATQQTQQPSLPKPQNREREPVRDPNRK